MSLPGVILARRLGRMPCPHAASLKPQSKARCATTPAPTCLPEIALLHARVMQRAWPGRPDCPGPAGDARRNRRDRCSPSTHATRNCIACVDLTYLNPGTKAGSRGGSATGLPFSTYRRHPGAFGVNLAVIDWLWQQEQEAPDQDQPAERGIYSNAVPRGRVRTAPPVDRRATVSELCHMNSAADYLVDGIVRQP